MKLKSLEQNKTYKKRKGTTKDTFEYTPRLVQPEFNIPIIRNDEDYTNSMDLSERGHLGQEVTNEGYNKIKRSVSNSLSKKNISFLNPSEKFANQTNEQDEETINQHKLEDTFMKMDFNSDNTIQNQQQNEYNIKKLESSINLKQVKNMKKRQSKYYSDRDSDNKIRMPSIASKELQYETNNQQENGPKLKSNFSYMTIIKNQLSSIQKKVIAYGFVYTFIVKLKKISGISTLQFPKISVKSQRNIEQMRLLNDMSQFNDKKYQQSKKDFNFISQSFVSLSKIDHLIKKQKSCCEALLEKIPVIHPNSTKLFFWDITNFIFIILNLVYVPIETVINTTFLDIYGDKWTFFISLSIIVYFFSILLSTNIGYYDKGYCIMDRDKILKRYMKLGLWLDILSTFPMFVSTINANDYIKIFNLLVILKIQWIDKFFNKYFEICTLKKKIYHNVVLKFFYILLKVLFFAHCYACIFLALAFHLNQENNWITKYGSNLEQTGWFTKYVYAFYWGITTMTTVGLGDLLPANIYEVSVLTAFMFVSCGTFAYSFNAIGIILEELNNKNEIYVKEMRLVSRYLQTKKVDQQLQLEVRKYIEYKFDFENDISTEEEKMVFSKLSSQIQEKIVISTNMELLKNCNFLYQNFSEKFLMKLCLHIDNESKLNKEIIYNQDEVQKDNLNNIKFYILESGQVELVVGSSGDQPIIIRNIKQGEDFGSIEFFNDDPRHYTSKAIGSTRLLSIERNKFIQLLKRFPQDYERFMMLVDNSKMNKNLQGLQLECYCCQKKDHTLKECPSLHYIANRETSILKKIFSHPQQRKHIKRQSRLKINSRFEIPIIQERARYFYDPNQSQEECPTPYSPTEDQILATQQIQTPNKNLAVPLLRQTLLPGFTRELDSPDKLFVQNHKLFRQTSIAYRLQQQNNNQNVIIINNNNNNNINNNNSHNIHNSKLRAQFIQNHQQLSEPYGDNSKTIQESSYSPMTTSKIRNALFQSKQNELSQHAKDFQQQNRTSDFHYNSIHPITFQNILSPNLIQANPIYQQEFMIKNFEKHKTFRTYFQYNNIDMVLREYELARPHFKSYREMKQSQYFLFPLYQKSTKLKLNSSYTSPLQQKAEGRMNMTFMDSLHI